MLFDASAFVIEPQPRNADVSFNWSILRTPTDGRSLSLVLVSSRVFGIRTHFYRRRTTPHLAHACPACADGGLSRWSGYVLAWEWPARRNVIFEFTPKAAEHLFAISERVGSLRASQVVASRYQKRANGQVRVDYKGEYQGPAELPKDEDILPILLHIWGLTDREGNIREQPGRAAMTPAEIASASDGARQRAKARRRREPNRRGVAPISEAIEHLEKRNGEPLPGQLNLLDHQ